MGVVAGANEAEQTPQGVEHAPRKPETATAHVPGPATATVADPAPATPAGMTAATVAEPRTATMGEATTEPAAAPAADPTAATGANATAATGAEPTAEQPPEQTPPAPGFGERGRMRRRARFLRKARELAYRDLGGLVFDLHRFGQRNDPLVLAKLATLRQIDSELRELEDVLSDRRPVTVLREVGIAACPRCAAIHGSDDRFCPGCGLAFDTNADRPISTAPVNQPAAAPAPVSPQAQAPTPPTSHPPAAAAAPTSAPAPTPTSAPAPAPANASAPPVKPTAAPIAAKTTHPAVSSPASPKPREADRPDEDEPTQILRPPERGM